MTTIQHAWSMKTLAHRWPTLLGIAVAALTLSDGSTEPGVGAALAVAAAGYVAIAALDRPGLTWPMALVLFAGVTALRAFDLDPTPALAGVWAVAVVGGLLTGTLRRSRLHALQVPVGLLGLAAFATALHVPMEIGAVIVAVGLLAHAVWDAVVWRRGTVLARSFTEWCGVFDVVVAVGLLVLLSVR